MFYETYGINPQLIYQVTEHLELLQNKKINSLNAAKIGGVSLIAIEVYTNFLNNHTKLKKDLDIWVRQKRIAVRNHGRILHYKGASRERANLNANISNLKDQYRMDFIDLKDISDSHLSIAKERLTTSAKNALKNEIDQQYYLYINYFEEIKNLQQDINKSKADDRLLLILFPLVLWVFLLYAMIYILFNLFRLLFLQIKFKMSFKSPQVKNFMNKFIDFVENWNQKQKTGISLSKTKQLEQMLKQKNDDFYNWVNKDL